MVSTKSIISPERPIPILTGPTATGKSAIALEWARKVGDLEIINADSLLVYRHFDIGTAKPTQTELAEVAHHLINIRNPDEVFTAGEFFRNAQAAIQEIESRGKRPVIVGGTGFYLQALLFGIWDAPPADPELRKRLETINIETLHRMLQEKDTEAARRIGPADRYRLVRALELIELSGQTPTELQGKTRKEPDPRFRLWIIDRSNEELHQRIHLRSQAMIEAGLIDEVRAIEEQYPSCRPLSSVGYAQVVQYLRGEKPHGRALREGILGLQDEIELSTRQLVKKQRTWFKNQCQKVPHSRWFQLEKDRSLLEEAFTKEI